MRLDIYPSAFFYYKLDAPIVKVELNYSIGYYHVYILPNRASQVEGNISVRLMSHSLDNLDIKPTFSMSFSL